MGPINLFVFTIFKTTELVGRNCLIASIDEEANQGDLQENRSRPANLQDMQSANEGYLQDGRGSRSETQRDLGLSQGSKDWEDREVYDNRVFSTNE